MPGPPTFFTSWQQLAIACAVLLVAEAVYVAFGFGAGLISVGALAATVPSVTDVVTLLLLVNIPIELWVTWRAREHVRWRGVLPITAGVILGTPFGARALRVAEPTFILALLGGVLIVSGLAFLSLPDGFRVRWSRAAAPVTGIFSGVLSGLFGTGGPPLVLYYQLSGVEKAAFRGNLMAIFLLLDFVRVPSYAFEGLLTAPRLGAALVTLPVAILGAVIGGHVHIELEERTFRRVISVAIIVIGGLLLARG